LFSTGRGDAQDINTSNKNNHFSLYFDQNKDLVLRSASKTETIISSIADNNWHHFALSVNSRGNANIYIDANLQTSIYSSDYFEGFKGNKLWLGATGWEKDILTDTVSMFYRGMIDELRIWQAALTQEGIKLSATSRLQGDEIGLRAYFPFDSIETNTIVNNTLCDQIDTSRIENGNEIRRNEPMTLNGGADFSTVAANVKPNRRMQNVQFERVYKDDQIALTLLSPMSSIENCIMDISVSDIKDMHGNIIASPVKWTAFIDRNYFKWSEEKLSFVKNVFDPLSFNVVILNRSGLEQMYSIENLPAWLSVNHLSGTIPPSGSIEVTFTVNEGLNIGTYDENIYLRNSSGVNELLALDLRVIGEQPQWDVDPNAFDYSMNIFGEINIKGIVSTDAEDILAAFNTSGECAGYTKLRYIAEYDRYLAFLNVYGNTSGMPVEFKIWDASTGIIYAHVLPDTLTFTENSYKGTAKNPITFRALNIIEQVIDVNTGWNWISTNICTQNGDMSPQGVLGDNAFTQNDHLKGQQPGIFTSYTNGVFPPFNANTQISNAEMYMLKVEAEKRLILTGEVVNPDTATITVYPQGWTWIGYTPQINLSLNEAFAGLNPDDGDLVKSQNAFSVYYEGTGGWLGTLNYLTPGNGYLYSSQSTATRTFFYPNVSTLANNHKSTKVDKYLADMDKELAINRGKYQYNLTLIARLDAEEVSEFGGNILSYVQGECRGYGEAVYLAQADDNLYFITISGDRENQSLDFRYRTDDGNEYTVNEKLKFINNKTYGTVTDPIVFTLGGAQIREDNDLTAYPVPFSNTLTLSYIIDKEAVGDIVFTVLDITGKTLTSIPQTQSEEGMYTLSLDTYMANLAQGVYFIKMQTSASVQTVKVIKSK
jgi:hypothetical protein